MKIYLLSFLGVLVAALCTRVQAGNHEISIDLDAREQVIDGFGAANLGQDDNYYDLSLEKRQEFIDTVFGPEKGLGLSIYRLGIIAERPGDRQSPPYINWEHDGLQRRYKFAKMVQDRYDPALLASQWSPPGWMKTNKQREQGGKLLPEHYDDYAAWQAEFVKGLREKFGVEIDVFSFQNEPGKKKWASCEWTTSQIIDYLENHMVPAFIKEGLMPESPAADGGVELLVNEQTGWSDSQINRIFKKETLAAYIDYAGAHIYGGAKVADLKPKPFEKSMELGKHVWQTEYYGSAGLERSKNDSIEYALTTARIMGYFLVYNKVNAYNFWWIADAGKSRDRQSLLEMLDDNRDFRVQMQGWAFGQFSRFVRPGFYVVTVPEFPSPEVNFCAFSGPEGRKFVLIGVNDTEEEQVIDLSLALDGDKGISLQRWRTSAKEKLRKIEPVTLGAHGRGKLSLTPKSITTLCGTR